MEKYEPYSWFNDPEHSDATISNNLNAMNRHYLAHTMNFWFDGDGLPHLYHLLCRTAMLVVNGYRFKLSNNKTININKNNFKPLRCTNLALIHPILVYSLGKYKQTDDAEINGNCELNLLEILNASCFTSKKNYTLYFDLNTSFITNNEESKFDVETAKQFLLNYNIFDAILHTVVKYVRYEIAKLADIVDLAITTIDSKK